MGNNLCLTDGGGGGKTFEESSRDIPKPETNAGVF
jgi:hypothetical protein